jgi:hypothetical protein
MRFIAGMLFCFLVPAVAPQACEAQENTEAATDYPRVCCRPLYKFSHSRLPAARLLGLAAGRFDHCFIETRPGVTIGIHPIEPHATNKQPIPNEETDTIAYGGDCKKIKDATPEEMQRLQQEIDVRACFSCGKDYYNKAGIGSFNNSNTYVFDMLKGAGLTSPPFPHAPGYHARQRPLDPEAWAISHSADRSPIAAAITTRYPGAAMLSGFSRAQDASLLVYVRSANNLALLQRGTLAPLDLKTHLSVSNSCCDHRALPALSHSGGRLSYVRMATASPHREVVSIYDLGSHSRTDVFEAPDIWAVSWAPADERLAIIAQSGDTRAFAGENDLYVLDLSSKQPKQLTHGSFLLQGIRYSVSPHAAASWDPAGNRLAVEVRRSGEERDDAPGSAIAVFDLQSNAVTKLTDGTDPSWSPVEDRIAFVDRAGKNCFTIGSDGSAKKKLFSRQGGFFSTGSGAPIFFPVSWSPKGDQLLFHQWVDDGMVLDVYRFDVATSKAKWIGRGELQVVDWRAGEDR